MLETVFQLKLTFFHLPVYYWNQTTMERFAPERNSGGLHFKLLLQECLHSKLYLFAQDLKLRLKIFKDGDSTASLVKISQC